MMIVMRRFLATVTRYGFVTILLASSGIAHCEEDAFSRWAAAHAVALTTVEPSEDLSDLLPLKSMIGKARVVALGEPMHGAHEPLAFRNRLIRFLVEQVGFTAVALESGFTESINARSFVEGGDGDAETAAQTGKALRELTRRIEVVQSPAILFVGAPYYAAAGSEHAGLGAYDGMPRRRNGRKCAVGIEERRSAGASPRVRSRRSCDELER
jgi:hypothetical protein